MSLDGPWEIKLGRGIHASSKVKQIPLKVTLSPGLRAFLWDMRVSLWDVPGSGQLQTQSCVTLRDVLLSLCTSDERPCDAQTSKKAVAGRREMGNAVFVPPALPAAKDEAIC